MRVAFFALLLANLLYLGWAEWIDVPGPPPASPIAGLRPLTLVKELPPDKRAAVAKKMALATAPPPQCVSVGPFDDPGIADRAAALLRAKSFAPRQRAAEILAMRRFWVYLDGFASDAAVTRALHKLERGGIDDAEAMPPESGRRRISLGLFADREHADARSKLVHKLGFEPAVTARMLPGTVYWLDVTLPSGSAPVPLKEVSDLEPAPGEGSSPISVQSCPNAATPVAPPAAPSPAPAAPALQKAAAAATPVPGVTLPPCKPGGGGPVPCIVLKEAKQPSVL